MISEELLRRAAARSCACYAAALAQGYDPAEGHVFSPAFEQRMARLCRRAEHPALYTGLQRAAAILLAALIAGTAWLAVDVNARERFAGWLREVRENAISYWNPKDTPSVKEPDEIGLGWVPEGYVKYRDFDNGVWISVGYKNETGELLRLNCAYDGNASITIFDTAGCSVLPCTVGDFPGEVILSDDPAKGNVILWTDREERFFYIAGYLTREELLKAANSIYEK